MLFFGRNKKLFLFSCMKSDLKNRPSKKNRFYGDRGDSLRLAPTRVKFWATRPPQTINTQLHIIDNDY